MASLQVRKKYGGVPDEVGWLRYEGEPRVIYNLQKLQVRKLYHKTMSQTLQITQDWDKIRPICRRGVPFEFKCIFDIFKKC